MKPFSRNIAARLAKLSPIDIEMLRFNASQPKRSASLMREGLAVHPPRDGAKSRPGRI